MSKVLYLLNSEAIETGIGPLYKDEEKKRTKKKEDEKKRMQEGKRNERN